MLITTLALTALIPLATAQNQRPEGCPSQRECEDIIWDKVSERCSPKYGITETCSTLCSSEYMNTKVHALQCELDAIYAAGGVANGSSTRFAHDEFLHIVPLHERCVDYGVVPPTSTLTEPPLPYPTPSNVVGRPRSCERVCSDANSTQLFEMTRSINFGSCYLYYGYPTPNHSSCRLYTQFCSVERFNKLAECTQCRLLSASSNDWYGSPEIAIDARIILDELYTLCHDMGFSPTNTPLYTQVPLPTDTRLAISAAPTTTYKRTASSTSSQPLPPTTMPSTTKAASEARITNPAYAAPVAAAAVGMGVYMIL